MKLLQVHQAGFFFTLTPEQDTSKDGVITVQCAAVPPMVSELVLALSDPLLGALADGLHDVWVALAELPLFVHKAGDVVTDYTSSQSPDVPESARNNKVWRCCMKRSVIFHVISNITMKWLGHNNWWHPAIDCFM